MSIKHGKSGTPIYTVWSHMKQRCDNPKNKRYKHYGGRGISYDPKWKNFEGFYEDMKEGYRKGLLIDRKDNNGNYCKSNCGWVNITVSNNNTRHNKILTFNGISLNIKQWEKKLGFKRNFLHSRINQRGWSIKKALTTSKRINQYV